MVNEDILRDQQPVPGLADTAGVVVVLEKTDLEPFVERADLCVDVPPEGEAEHRERARLEGPTPQSTAPPCLLEEAPVGRVAGLYLRFVPGAVGHRADRADRRVLQVRTQPTEPSRRHDAVAVEQDDRTARGCRDPLVDGWTETAIGVVEDGAHLGAR